MPDRPAVPAPVGKHSVTLLVANLQRRLEAAEAESARLQVALRDARNQIALYDMSANDEAGLSPEETVEAIRAALARREARDAPGIPCPCGLPQGNHRC